VEHDIPTLLIGSLTLTTLLPVVPVSIAPHLPDIFELFSRLASFTFNKTGQILFDINLALFIAQYINRFVVKMSFNGIF